MNFLQSIGRKLLAFENVSFFVDPPPLALDVELADVSSDQFRLVQASLAVRVIITIGDKLRLRVLPSNGLKPNPP